MSGGIIWRRSMGLNRAAGWLCGAAVASVRGL